MTEESQRSSPYYTPTLNGGLLCKLADLPLLPYGDLSLSVLVNGQPVTPGVPVEPTASGSPTWRYVAANNGTIPLIDVEFYHTAMSADPNFAPN